MRGRFIRSRLPILFAAASVLMLYAWASPVNAQVEGVRHVVIIGVDGLSPDGIQQTDTPHMDRIIRRGAHTFRARSVMPSSSSSNWASMIMGAGPEQHGVTSNSWEPDDHVLPPVCVGSGGIFPTIFGLVREQQPDAVTAVFHDWGGFGRLVEQDAPDVIVDGDGPEATTIQAAAFIKESRPLLTFIHLDHVDGAGHREGHGSDAYYASVRLADRLIGDLVGALEEAQMLEYTAIIISSDHGGLGTSHGGVTPEEMEIPWIVAGPGVRQSYTISRPVDTYDTAATAAYLLGVTPHDCWVARPVTSAFQQ